MLTRQHRQVLLDTLHALILVHGSHPTSECMPCSPTSMARTPRRIALSRPHLPLPNPHDEINEERDLSVSQATRQPAGRLLAVQPLTWCEHRPPPPRRAAMTGSDRRPHCRRPPPLLGHGSAAPSLATDDTE